MTTREGQIIEAANESEGRGINGHFEEVDAFKRGVEWAENNPFPLKEYQQAFNEMQKKLAIAIEALEHYQKIEDFRVSAKAFLALKKIKDMK